METPDITRAHTSLDGVSWNILGQVYTPKQATEESFAWHATFPEESFVPPHMHPYQDEYIFVLDGRIDLLLDGEKTSAATGDLVVAGNLVVAPRLRHGGRQVGDVDGH